MSKELLELIHRTRVSKYSESNPKDLIHRIVEEIKMKTGHYGFRSWELMVEYLAKWLVLNKKTGLACMPPPITADKFSLKAFTENKEDT